LAFYALIEAPYIAVYIHKITCKLGAVVGFNKEIPADAAKGLAMQVASMAPVSIAAEDCPKDVVEKEYQMAIENTKEEQIQKAVDAALKKAGINPMGGCIPMLIQLPLLWALFRFFPSSIELRGKSFLWADDLSSYDSVLDLPFSIPFYGDHVSLFALLMCMAMVGFSYFSYQQNSASQPQMAGMKFMMVYMMPAMMLFWFNDYASGLCYYYLVSQVITMIQMTAIRRFVDDDKIRALMARNASKQKNKKKSKFQLRYEELMRQQEEMMRQQQNAKRR
jgi:YidC/Oxa1 family membrane protein insertase